MSEPHDEVNTTEVNTAEVNTAEAHTAAMLDRIATRFPDVPRESIEHIAHEEHERLSGGRIQDYVPVLVEKETVERLRTGAIPVQTPLPEDS
ncbi:three-helix bundle dimerization domain-containing protein [Microbacterium sp. NPDC008134]|uniref:three-helix bundle dimerization domain-containing protein n=1 Tax=Microbacterium sp. NPDC008134 TaxID=3364183 RepID=UPI0036EA35CD